MPSQEYWLELEVLKLKHHEFKQGDSQTNTYSMFALTRAKSLDSGEGSYLKIKDSNYGLVTLSQPFNLQFQSHLNLRNKSDTQSTRPRVLNGMFIQQFPNHIMNG